MSKKSIKITTYEGLLFELEIIGKQLCLSVGNSGGLTVSSDIEQAELKPLMGNERYALHIGGSETLVTVYLANDEAKKIAGFLGIKIEEK